MEEHALRRPRLARQVCQTKTSIRHRPPSASKPEPPGWPFRRGGTAFGDAPSATVGGLFSVLLQALGPDALGFGVVKLMRQQVRGVHVRVYSNMYVERPLAIDETSLMSRPADLTGPADAPPSEPIAIGHIPLRHGTFAAWQPEFIATSLVDPDELIGYEQWKVAKGGFF